MLKTCRLTGKAAPGYDKQITANLLLDTVSEDEVRKEKMLIGLRNDAGEIYRLIGATKANSFTNAVEELIDLELTDELHDVDGTREGCDAIFRAD